MVSTPFIHRGRRPTVGLNVANIFGKRLVKGDIGIEIEVEGNKFQKESVPQPWGYHKDGSLRGHDNAEYVLNHPIKFDQVPDAIKTLWDMFHSYGSKLDTSNRTSVHVHLNMQKFHLNRLAAFVAMYFSLEEVLTAWCGDHRVGNLFCLRGKDAPNIVTQIKRFIQLDGNCELKEGLHYAGLNAQALYKFGSLEVRALRGCTEPDVILQWVSILERMYKLSADFADPRDVPVKFSSEGPMAYLEMILGDNTQSVLHGVPMDIHQVRDSLYEGIRLAQDICYCRDWSLYKATEIKEDPFGRSAKKMAQVIAAQAVGGGLFPPAATASTAYVSAPQTAASIQLQQNHNYTAQAYQPTGPNTEPMNAGWSPAPAPLSIPIGLANGMNPVNEIPFMTQTVLPNGMTELEYMEHVLAMEEQEALEDYEVEQLNETLQHLEMDHGEEEEGPTF